MSGIFEKLDGLVGFMAPIFESLKTFFDSVLNAGGKGAYISFLLLGVFLAIIFLIGLIKLMKKFGLFIFLVLIAIGIPCIWYFAVLPSL